MDKRSRSGKALFPFKSTRPACEFVSYWSNCLAENLFPLPLFLLSFFLFNGLHTCCSFYYLILSTMDMEAPFPAIFLVFVLTLCSCLLALSSTIGVDSISRLLEIQDRERAPPSVQEAATRGVLLRLLPSHSSSFEFRIVSKVFEFIWFSTLD